jgi:hypothetical protein
MSQSGFTPIQLYRTTTAAAVPVNTNLADGELAINTTDEKLYFKNAAGTVKLLASTAGSAGDVVGPASATDGNLAAFDGATGKLIKQAATVTVGQGGTGATTLASGGYLKGAGTSAITSQTGIPAGDITSGTLGVDRGGTGIATTTAYSVVFSGTTATGAFQAAAGPGSAGQILTSNGAGALPTFQTPAASGATKGQAIAFSIVFGL